jgi:hypothetical protein
MGKQRNVHRVFMEKPEETGLLGRCTRKWEDSIEINHKDELCRGRDWIQKRAGFSLRP